jgi:hypothetical protein
LIPRSLILCFAAVIIAFMLVGSVALIVDGPTVARSAVVRPSAPVALEITATHAYTAYLPLIKNSRWEPLPLVNGGFELDWSVES